MERVTLDDIKQMDREILTPAIVSQALEIDQQNIRYMARNRPELLGFPVSVFKSRTKIPRRAFVRFMEYGFSPFYELNDRGKKMVLEYMGFLAKQDEFRNNPAEGR